MQGNDCGARGGHEQGAAASDRGAVPGEAHAPGWWVRTLSPKARVAAVCEHDLPVSRQWQLLCSMWAPFLDAAPCPYEAFYDFAWALHRSESIAGSVRVLTLEAYNGEVSRFPDSRVKPDPDRTRYDRMWLCQSGKQLHAVAGVGGHPGGPDRPEDPRHRRGAWQLCGRGGVPQASSSRCVFFFGP